MLKKTSMPDSRWKVPREERDVMIPSSIKQLPLPRPDPLPGIQLRAWNRLPSCFFLIETVMGLRAFLILYTRKGHSFTIL